MFKQLTISITACVLGAFHISMTALYLLPTNPVNLQLHALVDAYMMPMFYQSWHLFSPNPGISSDRLWFRFQLKTESWTNWADPTEELRLVHESRVIPSAGRRLRIYEGLAEQLREAYDDAAQERLQDSGLGVKDFSPSLQQAVLHRVMETGHFDLGVRYAMANMRLQFGSIEAARVQLRLVRFVPPKYSQYKKGNNYRTAKILDFPPVQVVSP